MTVADLIGAGDRLMPLGPGTPNAAMIARAGTLSLPPAALAGLYLYFDGLDESHAVSQDLPTPAGSFWHAVMHRREPDPANSKYWWRRVGPHPVFDRLRAAAPAVGYDYSTPEAFVDFCEQVRDTGTSAEEAAKRVQSLEWQFYFAHGCQGAGS